MSNKLKAFMNNNNLTIRKLSKMTGISKSTLNYQLNQPVNNWKYGMLKKIAKAVNTTPAQVVHEFRDGGWHLNIDDKRHTVQGVYMGNNKDYLYAKDIIINEYFEGWQPSSSDIKALKYSYTHPNDIVKKSVNQYVKYAKKAGIYLGKD